MKHFIYTLSIICSLNWTFSQNCGQGSQGDSLLLAHQVICSVYDPAVDSFLHTNQTRFTYDYLYIYDGYRRVNSLEENNGPSPGNFQPLRQVEFEFDSLGREIWQLVLNWNGTSYDSSSLLTRTYSPLPNGTLRIFTSRFWFGGLGQFTDRSFDTLDLDNLLIASLKQSWDNGNSTWHNFSRDFYQYDLYGNTTEKEHQRWQANTNSWVNFERENNSYNSQQIQTESIFSLWNMNNKQYEPRKRTLVTSIIQDFIEEELVQDYVGQQWENDLRRNFSYDSCGNQTEFSSYFWVDSIADWKLNFQIKNSYGSNGNLIESVSFGYNVQAPTAQIVNGSRCITTYNNVTSTAKSRLSKKEFIQRNPLPISTPLRFSFEDGQVYRIVLWDLQGKKVVDQKATGQSFVPLNQLAPGFHLLWIESEGKRVFSQKLWLTQP